MSAHVSAEFERDEDDFIVARCSCGWSLGPFPDEETAIDVLMEHAYDRGRADAKEEL